MPNLSYSQPIALILSCQYIPVFTATFINWSTNNTENITDKAIRPFVQKFFIPLCIPKKHKL